MTNIELTLAITLIALCMAGMVAGAYFFGYARGAKWETPKIDPTPEYFSPGEVAPDIDIEITGYLDESTGPIAISTHTQSLEIIAVPAREHEEELELIALLTARLAKAERLRKRYLRLLKQERAMMHDTITGVGVQLSPYWRRWVHLHFSDESPFWLSQSWARIANTN